MSAWFAHPEWAWLLAVLLLLGVIVRRSRRLRDVRTEAWLSERAPEALVVGRRRAGHLANGSSALGAVCLVIAAMGPRIGTEERRLERPIDVVVALDVSRSMLARDVAPDRLRHARGLLDGWADAGRGNRFGLVAFAGEARLRVPLTDDASSFSWMLGATDSLAVSRGGSDPVAGLLEAERTLARSEGRGRAILLVTDADDDDGELARAAARLAGENIGLVVLGIGTRAGTTVPSGRLDEDGNERPIRDGSGVAVRVRLARAALTAVAEAGGGRLFTTEDPVESGALWEALRRTAPELDGDQDAEEGTAWRVLVLIGLGALLLGQLSRGGRT